MMIEKGQKAPTFCLQDMNKEEICLDAFKGKWIVIYFYPKDNTSGCTLEAIDFTNAMPKFRELDVTVIGISPDSVKSHCNFAEKHNLGILLLSDPEHIAIEKYHAWILKKMYGREYYGVDRSTFIISPEGTIAEVWHKVKVKNHVNNVLESLKQMVNRK